jgi:hypothetical protein
MGNQISIRQAIFNGPKNDPAVVSDARTGPLPYRWRMSSLPVIR